MDTVHKVTLEVRSGDERIGEAVVFASGADEEQSNAIAEIVIHGSFLWDDRIHDKSIHLMDIDEMHRNDVLPSEVVYGPDMLPGSPAPR